MSLSGPLLCVYVLSVCGPGWLVIQVFAVSADADADSDIN